MRTLMPLYVFAGDLATYARRVAELQAGDVAIVTSSNSGPGQSVDRALMQHIADLDANGVTVAGYVHVSYGSRTIDAVLDDIEAWHRFYGITRPFVDEWPADWGTRYVGAIWGMTRGYAGRGTPERPILVVNPGVPLRLASPPPGTLVVTYEGTTPPDRTPQPWEAVIVHSCPAPDAMRAALASAGWQWGYVTSDGPDGNPFDGILH